jgi:hypothetical protein
MKKIVFAMQTLFLTALFPVYMVVELNRETETLPVNNSSLKFTERSAESNIKAALNPKDKGMSFSILKTKTY